MGEILRISVSLKVDNGEETYWGLIKPLQDNRQLSSFIMTCLKAYMEDSDIHESIDNFGRQSSGIDLIKEHLDNLIRLQAKANREAEDISATLGGSNKETEISNVFEDDEEENEININDIPDNSEVMNEASSTIEQPQQKSENSGLAIKSDIPDGLIIVRKIVERLDSLELTVGQLSTRVGANAEHISQIEQDRDEFVEHNTGKTSDVAAASDVKSNTDKVAVKSESVAKPAIKEVKFEDIEQSGVSDDGGDILTKFLTSMGDT